MFTFERTGDMDLIRAIITSPKVYKQAMDDFAPARRNYKPPDPEMVWFVLAHDAGDLLGLFVLCPQNMVCYELHHALLPGKWIPQGKAALVELIPWFWERNAEAQRIVVPVFLKFRMPKANEMALDFVRDAGFTVWGYNPRSWQKAGRLIDQVWLGLDRPNDVRSAA